MLDTFAFAFNAIAPIVLITAVGYILKKIKLIGPEFIKQGNKLVFYVLLPLMLFYNVYKIDNLTDIDWSVILFAIVIICIVFFVGWLGVALLVKDKKQKGTILQCVFRSNFSIIGIPLAQALGGDAAVQYAAILSAFSIPLFNIFAVLALTMFIPEEGEKQSFGKIVLKTLKKMITNPLIIGIFVGLAFVGIRMLIPTNDAGEKIFTLTKQVPFLITIVENLQRCATPLALLILGGQFEFGAVKTLWKQIVCATVSRLILVPLFAITSAVLLSKYTDFINFSSAVYPALISLFASPVAVSSVIMAEEMNNDGELAAQLVVWTSLLSILTVFIFVLVLSSLGIIPIL